VSGGLYALYCAFGFKPMPTTALEWLDILISLGLTNFGGSTVLHALKLPMKGPETGLEQAKELAAEITEIRPQEPATAAEQSATKATDDNCGGCSAAQEECSCGHAQ